MSLNPVREKKSEASNKFRVISTYSVVVWGTSIPVLTRFGKKRSILSRNKKGIPVYAIVLL